LLIRLASVIRATDPDGALQEVKMRSRKKHSKPAVAPLRIEDCWIRRPEAAAHLGISPSLLEKLDALGDGPLCARIGRVRIYKRSILDQYAAERSQASTNTPQK